MRGFPLAGGIGFGLVLGWLVAGLGGGTRGAWPFRLALAAALLLAGLTVWLLAGPGPLIATAAGTVLGTFLRLAWQERLAARAEHPL